MMGLDLAQVFSYQLPGSRTKNNKYNNWQISFGFFS